MKGGATAPPGGAPGVIGRIEHTNLRPEASAADVDRLCSEAVTWGFFGVCVNPARVARAAARLEGTGVRVVTVCGFPLGAGLTETRVLEARHAVEEGAREVDVVIPIGRLKDGDAAGVAADLAAVVRASKAANPSALVKVILEVGLLTEDEIRSGCRLAAEAGADFVKTSTGFGPGGATPENVALLRAAVGDRLGVKASGGIRQYRQALALIEAGADRLGTSAGVSLAMEQRAAT